MSLAAHFGADEFYTTIDEQDIFLATRQTPAGELYSDECYRLHLRVNGKDNVLIEEVGLWTVLPDQTIIYNSAWKQDHFFVADFQGHCLYDGYIYHDGSLIYRQGDKILRKYPSGDVRIVVKDLLPGDHYYCCFSYDDVIEVYKIGQNPNSNYKEYYSVDGEFLEQRTKSSFVSYLHMLIALDAGSTAMPTDHETIKPLFEPIHHKTILTVADLDRLIEGFERLGIRHPHCSGYPTLRQVLYLYYGEQDISFPINTILATLASEELYPLRRRFISKKMAQLIASLPQLLGDDAFLNCMKDANKLTAILVSQLKK